jgi:hypothetical protein
MLMFFCQSFSRLVVYAAFYANRHFIEQNLCVNRSRPWLHCNGLCQLRKKLADDNKHDSDSPAQKAANELSAFFFHQLAFHSVKTIPTGLSTPLNGYYIPLVSQACPDGTFHPPAI